MDRPNLTEQQVREKLRLAVEGTEIEWHADTPLADLELDSLEVWSVVTTAEDLAGRVMPDDLVMSLTTVGDLVAFALSG